MRVVAGSVGGRRLRGPESETVRPTTDKVREAVFNSLESMNAVEGAEVLDLFAGTGACGIEALSRGAASATFVDRDHKALNVVKANLVDTRLTGRVVRSDALAFLAKPHSFDLAFLDPPYEFEKWNELLSKLSCPLAVCESDRPLQAAEGWGVLRAKRYGDTTVTLMERSQDHEDAVVGGGSE